MKNQKMNLKQLNIKSFVTSIKGEHVNTVQGGKEAPFPRPTAQPSKCDVSCTSPITKGDYCGPTQTELLI